MTSGRGYPRARTQFPLLLAAVAGLPLLLGVATFAHTGPGRRLFGPGSHVLAKLAISIPLSLLLLVALAAALCIAARRSGRNRPRGTINGALIAFAIAVIGQFVACWIICSATSGVLALVLTAGVALGIGEALRRVAAGWRRTPVDQLPVPVPGELWWAAVPFEERNEEKDRPCLVLAVSGRRASVLMITSKDHSSRGGYAPLPATVWRHPRQTTSWLRTDRLIRLDREKLRRREGKIDAGTWELAKRAQPRVAGKTG